MKRVNAVKGLMDVACLIDSSSDVALRKLFRVAALKDLPEHWRRDVKLLAKQIHRARGYQDRTLQVARKGNAKRALELIGEAEDGLKAARTRLVVRFGEPARGSLDLGAWVLKAARRSARRARAKVGAIR